MNKKPVTVNLYSNCFYSSLFEIFYLTLSSYFTTP